MIDFIEAMSICSYDVGKAAEMSGEKPMREIINDILEEAGLDAVAAVSAKS